MRLVLVVGPSGSGKDSLLRGARKHFGEESNLGFLRRYITRPPDANEDNYFIDPVGFALLKKVNFFASSWQAHGNLYGIPAHALQTENDHELLLLSISRSAIGDFEKIHDRVTTIEVSVRQEVLKERLRRRGRENAEDIEKRLQRAGRPVQARDLFTFDNSLDLDNGIASFTALLEKLGAKFACRV